MNSHGLGVSLIVASLAWASTACAREASQTSWLPSCGKPTSTIFAPDRDMVASHRQFSLPIIDYPAGKGPEGGWGWWARVVVNPAGQVVCYSTDDRYLGTLSGNSRRDQVISQIANWRYAPFIVDGKAIEVMVTEPIVEHDLVAKHIPLPNVPIERVHIALARTNSGGLFPAYRIDIYGDGRVVYKGEQFVDVLTKHTYRIGVAEVKRLVDQLALADIWSMRERYVMSMSHLPFYRLELDMGDASHRLLDFGGLMVGMPRAVDDFEHAIDDVAQSRLWLTVSSDTINALKMEHFDFESGAGLDLLKQAVANENSHDDLTMLQILKLAIPDQIGRVRIDPAILEAALTNRRTVLIEPLIARGALESQGSPDQAKIDAAFLAAIEGGHLASAQLIWAFGGTSHRPSLTFENDTGDNQASKQTRYPVTLHVSEFSYRHGSLSMLPVVQWLQSLGCDLMAVNADGDTLLHIAVAGGDIDLVRFLLQQGIDPTKRGNYNATALGLSKTEELALVLLEAGADAASTREELKSLRVSASDRHWQTVLAWLDAHKR